MAYKIFLDKEFDAPSDKVIFDQLVDRFKVAFKKEIKSEFHFLFGSLSLIGKEIDALYIHQNTVIAINFKPHSGKVEINANEEYWKVDGKKIPSKNPIRMCKEYRQSVKEILSLFNHPSKFSANTIQCISVFEGPIEFDSSSIPYPLDEYITLLGIDEAIDFIKKQQKNEQIFTLDELFYTIDELDLDSIIVHEEGQFPSRDAQPKALFTGDFDSEANKIKEFIQGNNGNVVYEKIIHSRSAEFVDAQKLNGGENLNRLFSFYNNQIYKHQFVALQWFMEGHNICVATSTGSGKSEVFLGACVELLERNPDAKILVIYPTKALAHEQQQRLAKGLERAQSNAEVHKIDGDIPLKERPAIISKASVLTMTPDVIHAWLLANIEDPIIQAFVSKIKLIIIDEVHTYSGVFGSNSAFLFRRLNHLILALGGKLPQYITASGTIENEEEHLDKLIGLPFKVVDMQYDSSPKNKIRIMVVDFDKTGKPFNQFVDIVTFAAESTPFRSISFVDSRKQAEQSAAIINRGRDKSTPKEEEILEEEDNQIVSERLKYFSNEPAKMIMPYRSGYERKDAERIQKMISEGELRGVISTSALEMGIDIKGLDLGILLGVPSTATSFFQRIGRIGRHKEGLVIIINDGSVHSAGIFLRPNQILDLPVVESAMYLDNKFLQYIHTLCFASRQLFDGEYTKINPKDEDAKIKTTINFPANFLELCEKERTGQIPLELSNLKQDVEQSPQRTFPLRDLEKQFRITYQVKGYKESKGAISHSQLMKEAYPGAIYYYMGQSFRVYKINKTSNEVFIKKDKNYITTPLMSSNAIWPNFIPENITVSKKIGDLVIIETVMNVTESVYGFRERRGSQLLSHLYKEDNEYIRGDYFNRTYATTGVMLFHPALDTAPSLKKITDLLFEIFLSKVPFERTDIDSGFDHLILNVGTLPKGTKFISVFDGNYGSLRLSHKFTHKDILRKVFHQLVDLIQSQSNHNLALITELTPEDIQCILQIKESLTHEESIFDTTTQAEEGQSSNNNLVDVLLPLSDAKIIDSGEVFTIRAVILTSNGLMYQYRFKDQFAATITKKIGIDKVEPIEGDSEWGKFNLEEGCLVTEEEVEE